MRIEVELLGIVNDTAKNEYASTLPRKYIVKVTAEQLYVWLQYERFTKGVNSKFKISEHSTITIDAEIQHDGGSQRFLPQNPSKIVEIVNTLLTPPSKTTPRLFFGSLTWNVRPRSSKGGSTQFEIAKVQQTGKSPQWRLAFETEKIFLIDSVHRHLGIAEAYKQYANAPEKYPAFSPKLEFSVELFTLEQNQEKELFSELNSAQQKTFFATNEALEASSAIERRIPGYIV